MLEIEKEEKVFVKVDYLDKDTMEHSDLMIACSHISNILPNRLSTSLGDCHKQKEEVNGIEPQQYFYYRE